MILENKITQNKTAFLEKVKSISSLLGIAPDWLMLVMYIETAHTFNPTIVSPKTGATGLIQFMPSTAQSLGTTTSALAKMSNVQQLDYVYKYLKPYTGRFRSLVDVYFAVFFPLAIGKPSNWVLQTTKLSASLIAAQNPLWNTNGDQQITVSEVANYLEVIKKKWGL